MLRIKNLTIKNFRSIENISLDCSDITAFVGQNDAGKSNILRALNLFFNGETDHALPFDFNRDYNIFSPQKIRKAKEILVELVIELPDTYIRDEFPNDVVWRKVWRANGLHIDGCYFRYSDKQEFPSRSRIPLLLERMVYNYVPAIKDKNYFADLQGQVYDVLQTVAEAKLRESATSFEKEIQGHLKDLLSSVSDVFHSDNDMRLPENLRQVFENLEFNSNGIPLSRRGDGIKVRHIPMILRFIAEKRNSIHKQGISHHIWGFEEPENNVEMAACFDLADQFLEASTDEYQIFITTHSPVFYGLSESNGNQVKVYSVSKKGDFSMPEALNKQTTDHEMGLMQLVAPYVNKERETWLTKKIEFENELEKLKKEKVTDKQLPHIFVEGRTDEIVLKKAINLFFPSLIDKVKINAGGENGYGSAEAAASRAIAWQLIQQHNLESIKGWLLLDNDDAGIAAKKKFEDAIKEKNKHIKAVYWEVRKKPLGMDAGFKLPIDLESLYTDEVWDHAEKQSWLEDLTNPSKWLTDKKQREILDSAVAGQQQDLFGGIDLHIQRRIRQRFSDKGKTKAATWLSGCADAEAKRHLCEVEHNLAEIFTYFELINS